MKKWLVQSYLFALLPFSFFLFSCGQSIQIVNPPSSYLQVINKKDFNIIADEEVERLMQKHKIEAVSISYVLGQRKYIHRSYQTSTSNSTQIDSSSIFQAADISKTIAVLSLLPLVEDQKFNLEKDMRSFAKNLGIKNNYPDNYMALRNVIKHRGGFNIENAGGYTQNETLPTLDQLINGEKPAKNKALEVSYEPFKTYQYSDGAYLLVQKQIEHSMNLSYIEFCDRFIFNTIEMNSSSLIRPKDESKVVKGMLANGKRPKKGYLLYPAAAANGLWSSSADLAKLLHFFLWNFEENSKLVTGHTIMKMIGDKLGLNYNVQYNSISNYGINDAYTSHISGSLVNKNGIAIMCNSGNGGKFIDELYSIINKP